MFCNGCGVASITTFFGDRHPSLPRVGGSLCKYDPQLTPSRSRGYLKCSFSPRELQLLVAEARASSRGVGCPDRLLLHRWPFIFQARSREPSSKQKGRGSFHKLNHVFTKLTPVLHIIRWVPFEFPFIKVKFAECLLEGAMGCS